MEVSNKKITSPLVTLLFISAIFIQCLPYVSAVGISDPTIKKYQTPPSPVSPNIPAQPTPDQNYQTPPSRASPKIPAQPTPSLTMPSPRIPTGSPPSRTLPAKKFCIPKPEATDAQLQANLDWACTNQGVDCGPTQVGGPCFNPNTVRSHAAYVMNAYYQIKGRNDFNCDFSGSGVIVYIDPSYGTCKYLS